MEPEPRMVSARAFAAWWEKLHELANPGLNDKNAQNLLSRLEDIGKRTGAIRVSGTGSGTSDINPDFDWESADIDFSQQPQQSWYRPMDPEALVAELVRITCIKEHDTEDTPPMVERNQRDDN